MGACFAGYVTMPQEGKYHGSPMYSSSWPSSQPFSSTKGFEPRVWQRVRAADNLFSGGRLAVVKLTEGVVLSDAAEHRQVLVKFDQRCDDRSSPILVSCNSLHFEQLAFGADGKRRLAEAINANSGSKALRVAIESLQREYIDVDAALPEVQRRVEAEEDIRRAVQRKNKAELRRLLRVYRGRHVDLTDVQKALEH